MPDLKNFIDIQGGQMVSTKDAKELVSKKVFFNEKVVYTPTYNEDGTYDKVNLGKGDYFEPKGISAWEKNEERIEYMD